MFSSKKSGFFKNEDCPSSHELLAYQNGDLGRTRAVEVRKHMAACEFCAAEVEFYSHYPQADAAVETPEIAEIPAPLYELAEALLKHRHADAVSLNLLLKDEEPLPVKGIG
jgi:hypothetical protein